MNSILKPFLLSFPLALVACGGGGGSSGTTQEQYSISLRSEKSSLPVNISAEKPYVGVYAPYTTTMYVAAKKGSEAVPGGEKLIGCAVSSGLDSGSLVYLNGKDDGDATDGSVALYRAITLDVNSGGASFHLHSGSKAGVVTVVCSITDPRDGKVYTASTNVTVGGGSTNTAASINTNPTTTNVLGTANNVDNMRTSVVMQAEIWNDNNQPVNNAGKPNIQVSIRGGGASSGARLMADGKTAQSLQLSTNSGVAQYSVASGATAGVILIEAVADRADNDVSNGIQEPITHLIPITVFASEPGKEPLVLDATQLEAVEIPNGQPVSYPLAATGGTPPYTWTAVSGLPTGMSLTSAGLLQGTPRVDNPGTFYVTVRVADANGASATQRLAMTITGTLPPTPVTFAINGCTGNETTVCALPAGVVGSSYSYALTATGGGTITWKLSGAPTWLRADGSGTTGMLYSGATLTCANVGTHRFFVTASNATNAVTRQVSITVPDVASCAAPVTPVTPTP